MILNRVWNTGKNITLSFHIVTHVRICTGGGKIHWNACFAFFFFRSKLWRFSTGTEWYYRKPWISSWLSKLCQLYMDHYHRRTKQDTIVVSYFCPRGRFWYTVNLWWTATARQFKSEVMYFFILHLFLSHSLIICSISLSSNLLSSGVVPIKASSKSTSALKQLFF